MCLSFVVVVVVRLLFDFGVCLFDTTGVQHECVLKVTQKPSGTNRRHKPMFSFLILTGCVSFVTSRGILLFVRIHALVRFVRLHAPLCLLFTDAETDAKLALLGCLHHPSLAKVSTCFERDRVCVRSVVFALKRRLCIRRQRTPRFVS